MERGLYSSFTARPTDGGSPIAGTLSDGGIVAGVDPTQRRFEWTIQPHDQAAISVDQTDFLAEGGGRFFARL